MGNGIIEIKKTFWSDAGKAGAVLGLVMAAFAFAAYALGLGENALRVIGIFNFIAIAVTIYIYGRQRAVKFAGAGATFSFFDSLLYSLAIVLFAGFIFGVGQWIIITWITGDAYRQSIEASITQSRQVLQSMMPQDQIEQSVEMVRALSVNPVFIIISYMMNVLVTGLLIGLLTAVFIRTERRIG